MTRTFLGVAVVMAGLSGCSSPAHVVSKDANTGIVTISVPDNSPYHRHEAMLLAEKEVGPGPEQLILHEEPVGPRTNNTYTSPQNSTGSENTMYQITFKKRSFMQKQPANGPGNVQQTQYLNGASGAGMQPGGTGIQPASAYVPSVQPGPGRGMMPDGSCANGNCPIR